MLGERKQASFSRRLALLITMAMNVITPVSSLQFCGQDLANALALVCSETGYNIPQLSSSRHDSYDSGSDRRYSREIRVRRVTRGIVDECCRASCGWSTIGSYCRPPSSTTPENLQIQKRSDSPIEALLIQQVRLVPMDHSQEDNDGIRHEKRRLFSDAEEAVGRKSNRVFHSAVGVDDDTKRRLNSLPSNKVKRNGRQKPLGNETVKYNKGTTFNEAFDSEEIKVQLARHDEHYLNNVHRAEGRHHRAGKSHHKDQRGKGTQVGTIPPFFMGKTLVSPRARRLPF